MSQRRRHGATIGGGGGREPFEVDSFHAMPVGIMLNAEKFAGDRHRRHQSSEVRGANVNLCQPIPCQELKTHRICSTIFWDGPQIHI